MKKTLAIIIVMLMALNMSVMGETQQIISYEGTDVYDHWGYDVMSKWISKGFITGYPDGTYRPDGKISKAEFITLINRVFGYYEISDENYNDITINDWYKNQTLIAKKNKYMDWYSDDNLIPNNKITRQEVSAILVHITNIKETEGFTSIQDYNDKDTIPEWSTAYIDAVVNKGYMTGYSDNTLRPNGEITRAEAVTMLDRVVGVLIDEEGTYGPSEEISTIYNNITITAKDVVLQNTVIKGDLILAAGIKDGEVNLNNVTVEGQTIVNGGGENSITFTNCNVGDIIVYKVGGKVRVVSKDSTIGKAILESSSKLKGSFKDVSIKVLGAGDTIELEGSYDEIVLESKVQVEVSNSSKIDVLEVTETGSGSEIDLKTAAEVKTLRFKGAADVKGKGKIVKAVVEADGATTEQRVTRKIVKSGVDGSDVKVVVIPTSSTPPSPSDTTAPEVGNGGSITTSKVLPTSITLSWTKGTDNKTEQSNLKYLAYYSTSNNLDTVDNIESNGTAVGSYISNIDTVDVTGLFEDTTYYFNVIVKDEAGNKSAYTMVSGKTTIIVPDGSLEKPFRITHIEDLASIGRTDLKADWSLDKNYILTKDLDFDLDASYKNPSDTSYGDINEDGNVDGIKYELTNGKGWKPIATVYTNPFIGSFDGNNKIISHLYINRNTEEDDDYIGLFGYSGSTEIYGYDDGLIKNLGLENVDIIGYENVGTIAGVNREGSIINCYSTGNVTAIDDDAGGIVGYNSKGKIENSYSYGNITAKSSVGGIVGSQNQNGVIKECFSTGKVIATDSGAGGIAGGVSRGSIVNSFSTGEIVSNENSAGGIVGSNHYGAITNCYSTGKISANNDYAGGVVGYTFDSPISSCYSIGIVTSSNEHAGGIAGFVNQGGIQNCIAFNSQVIAGIEYASRIVSETEGSTFLTENYANSSMSITINGSSTIVSSSDSSSIEGSGVNAETLRNKDSYNKDGFVSGWDFTTWEIKSGADRPTLQGVGDDDGIIPDVIDPTPSTLMSGLGTEADPYVIMSIEDLLLIGTGTNIDGNDYSLSASYALGTNLDFNSVDSYDNPTLVVGKDINGDGETTSIKNELTTDKGFNLIGKYGKPFTGIFDGNGHTISNLFIHREDVGYVGLFGKVDSPASIKNIGILSGTVNGSGGDGTGALIGFMEGGTVDNCYASVAVTGTYSVGGLIGYTGSQVSSITNCYATSDVYANYDYTGGLIGYNNALLVSNCYSEGNISGIEKYKGGLIGYNNSGSVIEKCYAIGNVTTDDYDCIGGLVGQNEGIIDKCYASGQVEGSEDVGGLVGYNTRTIRNSYATGKVLGSSYHVGGLVGENNGNTSLVSNCYAIGDVEAYNVLASVVGHNYDGVIYNSIGFSKEVDFRYSDSSTIARVYGLSTAGGVTDYNYAYRDMIINENSFPSASLLYNAHGKSITTDDFKNTGDFFTIETNWKDVDNDGTVDIWDFTNIWEIKDDADRPTLQGLGNDDGTINSAPTVENPISNQTGAIGTSFNFTFDANVFNDVDGDSLTYTASPLPSGIIFTQETRTFNGTPTATGTTSVEVTASDGKGGTVSDTFDIVIKEMTGLGTEIDPFIIMSIEDLCLVGSGSNGDGNDYSISAFYKLGENLDYANPNSYDDAHANMDILSGWDYINGSTVANTTSGGNSTGFTPISEYRGVFDGNNKTIDNLYINSDADYVGLIAVLNSGGTIKNLGITNVDIRGAGRNVGAIIGYNDGIEINNCYSTGSIISSYDGGNVGGLIGSSNDTFNINDSYSTAEVRGKSTAGGVIGYGRLGMHIANCHATGNVYGSGDVGGLMGYIASGTIENCYATGSVSDDMNKVEGKDGAGGLLGRSDKASLVNCYATGNVIGVNNTGGLAGIVRSGDDNSKVINCYATGNISGVDNSGGLVGNNDKFDIENCYAIGNVITTGNNVGGIAGYLSNSGGSRVVNSIAFNETLSGNLNVNRIFGYTIGGLSVNSYAHENMLVNGSTIIDGQLNNQNGANLTTDLFKDEIFYTTPANWNTSAWDFTNVWEIKTGADRPTLRSVGDDDGSIEVTP